MVEGDSIDFSYTFVNSGDADILIESIEACHCTNVTFPKDAIAPGENGIIQATFYSEDLLGENKKALLIWYNDVKEPFKLRYAVTVKKARKRKK